MGFSSLMVKAYIRVLTVGFDSDCNIKSVLKGMDFNLANNLADLTQMFLYK